MKVFDFDPGDHRDAYRREGWVHVKGGATPEFLSAARRFVLDRTTAQRLGGRGLAGQKDQYLFELPAAVDPGEALFDVLAHLTGLRRSTMTLSERHVKAYSQDADPMPAAHKDRLSSQISVGISVEVPLGSHLVLYPHHDRWVNPFLSTGLRGALEPDRLPEVVLAGAEGVEIHDEPGDVVVFPGSSVWHLRRRSAGAVNIYLKFNDFDADPLGEDPSTDERRAATLAALRGPAEALVTLAPVLSRRFDSIVEERSRVGWRRTLSAVVWGGPPVTLSDAEAMLLRSLEPARPISSLQATPPGGLEAEQVEAALRRLAERGVCDLLPAVPTP